MNPDTLAMLALLLADLRREIALRDQEIAQLRAENDKRRDPEPSE